MEQHDIEKDEFEFSKNNEALIFGPASQISRFRYVVDIGCCKFFFILNGIVSIHLHYRHVLSDSVSPTTAANLCRCCRCRFNSAISCSSSCGSPRLSCSRYSPYRVLPPSVSTDDSRLFCGDLGNELNDDVLSKAFSRFPSFNMARITVYTFLHPFNFSAVFSSSEGLALTSTKA
ncbi:uncharacterized protein [Coffea arabica]|uniref:Uncharacterized protein isoform X2 n=1 Tax=Coffea arabica TaxID=13443 RepID=A0A6P6WIG2_COFAR|nr:uncharacterized protein LOC113732617 isoform X2 [Coffea arabica]XP_027116467.1 uncharacterized protein LOC113734242 isoform X2 [Coffea arabica]